MCRCVALWPPTCEQKSFQKVIRGQLVADQPIIAGGMVRLMASFVDKAVDVAGSVTEVAGAVVDKVEDAAGRTAEKMMHGRVSRRCMRKTALTARASNLEQPLSASVEAQPP